MLEFQNDPVNDLKDLLSRNGYPRDVIAYNMNDVVNRNRNKPKDPITTVPKRDVFIVLPYLGLHSKFIAKQLKSCIYKFYGCINLKIIFRNTHRINSLFPYKDRLNRSLMYQSNRGFNIPPRATPRAFEFLENFCSNSPLPRPKSCSNAPS